MSVPGARPAAGSFPFPPAAFGAVVAFLSLTVIAVSPVHGQSCTPSADPGLAARSSESLTNPAGTAVVVSRQGERGLDATESATNHGTILTCGEVHEYTRDDGTPARRRAHAVQVDSNSGGGAAAENNGLIETRGRGARGMAVFEYGDAATATATATNRGRIVTRGDFYDGSAHFGNPHIRTTDGVLAETGRPAGDAVAINERNSAIEVHGTGARGMWAWTLGTGEARGINRGTITTRGDAFGGPGSYGSAAAGIAAQSSRGSATAINEEGATIRTHGDGAPGLLAVVHESDEDTDVRRAARAENHGTVHVSGSWISLFEHDSEGYIRDSEGNIIDDDKAEQFTVGVGAVTLTDGPATVLNTGDVIAEGSSSIGLYASDGDDFNDYGYGQGRGEVTVRMTGGSVTAGTRDNPDTAEDESSAGVGIVAITEYGRAKVSLSGNSTTVLAYDAQTDNPDTWWDDRDDSAGIVALGWDEESQRDSALVEISGGVTVTAEVAVNTNGDLNLSESQLTGDVLFIGTGNVLTIENHGHIAGDVEFSRNGGSLVLDVTGTGAQTSRIDGAITGIEEMYKRGPGTAWVRDVTFSGSALALEEGGLTLAGHLDLGADGTLTVHDESRLTVEVGDITEDATDHGRITAGGGVVYEGLEAQENPELFMQIGADAAENRDAIEARLQQEETAIDVLGENTAVLRRTGATSQPVAAQAALRMVGDDGTAQTIGTLSDDGTAVVQMCPEGQVGTPPNCTTPPPEMCPEGQVGTPPNCTTPPPEMCPEGQIGTPPNCTTAPRKGDGGSSNAGALLIGGGAAALAVYLFDLFDSEEAALVDGDESWTGSRTTTSFAGINSGNYREHRVRTGALEQWTRAFSGDSSALAGGVDGTVRGIAVGLDATLPRGFHIGASMMPSLAASAHRGPSLHFGANAKGARYAVRGGWRGEALFVDTNLSHGRYRTQAFMENPAVGGLLGGAFNLTQNHAQGRAGARLDLGRMLMTPSVSLFSGALAQGAHTARGAAVSAEVPGFTQRYAGWRAKLDLAPSGWLDGPGALSWRPSLHFSTTRTRTSGPGSLHVRQSDREGVLSFASRAAVKGLPRTVHGIGASLVAARSDAWNVRMGYAAMVVDGEEPVHAAVARLMIRF